MAPDSVVAFVGSGKSSPGSAVGGESQRDPSLPFAAADVQITANTAVYGGKGQLEPPPPGEQISASTAVYGGQRDMYLPVAAAVSGEITAVVDGQNSTGFPVIVEESDLEEGVRLVRDTCVGFGVGSTNPTPAPEFHFSDWDPKPHNLIVLFVISEVLGMMFEIIYEESHIVPYFIIFEIKN